MSTASSHPTAGTGAGDEDFSPHRAESRTATHPPPGGGVRPDQWAGFARNSSGQIMGIALPIPLSAVTATVSISSSQRSARRGASSSNNTRAQSPPSQAATGAAPEWKELVKEAASLVACFQRLHATNEGVCFWNADRTLKLMLRNNPESGPDSLSAELLLLCDEDGDDDSNDSAAKELETIMELDVDSYSDGDAWVLEEFVLDASVDPSDDAVAGIMATINKVYNMRICDCRKYMLREQDTSTCCFCLLTGTAEDREPVSCPICYAVGPRLGFRKQECCGQLMHTSCLNRWHATSANTCPWCRHDPTAAATLS